MDVIVFDSHRIQEHDWPPENAIDFLAWFRRRLEKIPPKYQKKAEIRIESVGDWECSHYARITISYHRPDTLAEKAERKAFNRGLARERRKTRQSR